MKNVCEVLLMQVQFCGMENSMFHPERKKRLSEVISASMTTFFFHRCYEEMKREVMESFDRRVLWTEMGDKKRASFVVFVRIPRDKTVTTLTGTASGAYPVHDILLNVSPTKGKWLINNEHTPVGFLPVCCRDEEVEEKGSEEGEEIAMYGFTSPTTVLLEINVHVTGGLKRRNDG